MEDETWGKVVATKNNLKLVNGEGRGGWVSGEGWRDQCVSYGFYRKEAAVGKKTLLKEGGSRYVLGRE